MTTRINKLFQPCDALNDVFDPYAGTATNCPELDDTACDTVPCHYLVQFECNYYAPIPDRTDAKEPIAEPCLALKKDCVQGATWSSRWAGGFVDAALDEPVLPSPPNCFGCGTTGCSCCPNVECFRLHIESLNLLSTTYTDLDITLRHVGNCTYYGCYSFSTFDNECVDPHDSGSVTVDLWCIGNGVWRIRFNFGSQQSAGGPCMAALAEQDFAVSCDSQTDIVIDLSSEFGEGLCKFSGSLTPIDCPGESSGDGIVVSFPDSCCHWGDDNLYWEPLADYVDNCEDASNPDGTCFQKWVLAITSTTLATLTLTTRSGKVCIYTCTNVVCDGRSTFTLTTRDPDIYGLPACVCVVAVETDKDDTTCADGSQECVTGIDWDCGSIFYISICDQPAELVPMARDAALPCGVTTPSGYICGWFWGTYGLGDNACDGFSSLGFMVYPTGECTWSIDVYCYDTGAACWVFQSTVATSGGCECSGIYFTFTLPAMDCVCCEGGCCDECVCPDELTLTIDGVCSGIILNNFSCEYIFDGKCLPDDRITQGSLSCAGGCYAIEGRFDADPWEDVVIELRSCDPLDMDFSFTAAGTPYTGSITE